MGKFYLFKIKSKWKIFLLSSVLKITGMDKSLKFKTKHIVLNMSCLNLDAAINKQNFVFYFELNF